MIIYYVEDGNNGITLDNINGILEFLDNSDGLKLIHHSQLKTYYTSALSPKIFDYNTFTVT